MRQIVFIFFILLNITLYAVDSKIEWKKFDNTIFEEAKKQDKFILLTIGAAWCHWCHVMDKETYSNDSTAVFLKQNFILVREDQDSRPDLFSRYRAYGWPAIIIFDKNQNEILKLRGYQSKDKFVKILSELLKNPNSFLINQSSIPDEKYQFNIDSIATQLKNNLDYNLGGMNSSLKYLHLPTLEHFIHDGDSIEQNWVKKTIANSTQIIDPVWSGMYQYSAMGDWEHPHFEKLLRVQTNAITAYSIYAIKYGDNQFLEFAFGIYNYCNKFLQSESPLYYTSQNADLISGESSYNYYSKNNPERLKMGIPEVQKKVYLKENIMMCKALIYMWLASDNYQYLSRATINFQYILSNYKSENGLFKHEINSTNGFYLEENLYVLESVIIAYQLTQDSLYMSQALELATDIQVQFSDNTGLLRADININTLAPIYPYDMNCLNNILNFKLAMLTDNYELQSKLVGELKIKQINPGKIENLAWGLLLNKHVNENSTKLIFMLDKTSMMNPEFIFKLFNTNESLLKAYQIKNGESKDNFVLECNQTYCSSPIADLKSYKQKKRHDD